MTALQIFDPNYVPPRAIQLTGLGNQTDPIGLVLGGTLSGFDFSGSWAPESITATGVQPYVMNGFISGQPTGQIESNFTAIRTNKGLLFDAAKVVNLGQLSGADRLGPWNLRKIAAAYTPEINPAVLAMFAFTIDSVVGTGTLDTIAGYGHQTQAFMQWAIVLNQTTNTLRIYVGAGGTAGVESGLLIVPVTRNTLVHITLFMRPDGVGGAMAIDVMMNGVVVGQITGRSYPFNDPMGSGTTATPSARPKVGGGVTGGFTSGFRGIWHRGVISEVSTSTTINQAASLALGDYNALRSQLAL